MIFKIFKEQNMKKWKNIVAPDKIISKFYFSRVDHSFNSLRVWITISGKCRLRTTEGYCCMPFRYRGRRYNGCARTRRGRRWCAITPNYNKNKLWGYCRGGRRRKNVVSLFAVVCCFFGTVVFVFFLKSLSKMLLFCFFAAKPIRVTPGAISK